MSDSLWYHGLQHTRLPCPSLCLRVCWNSCSLSWSKVIKSSHSLLIPSHPALNLSQHQGLFQWVGSSHQAAEVLELQLCPRSSSKRTIHTKVWVDLVFEDCFRKWESSENKDSKRNLNGFFNFLDNFSKYYLRWRPRLSELWFSCHNLPGSSVELNKTPLEIQDWNLSGAKGTVYSTVV